MNSMLSQRNPRQVALCGIAVFAIIFLVGIRHGVLPAYDEWQALRLRVAREEARHAQLVRNLAVRESVDEQYRSLGPETMQLDSDEATISQFLRDMEAIARESRVTLLNAKPLRAEDHRSHKTYRIKLALAGKLQDIIRFVTAVVNGPGAIGLERFSLRGRHHRDPVECGLSLRMVRLIAGPGRGQRLAAGAGRMESGNGR